MNRNTITTPILNFINTVTDRDLFLKLLDEQSNLHHLSNKSAKNFHIEKLGKQDYCQIIGIYRCWIWEGNNWRAYTSKRGISFEVDESLILEDALAAWNDYYERMRK